MLLAVVLINAYTQRSGDPVQAHLTLMNFFKKLSEGNYGEAAQLYGGSYEMLSQFNPDIHPEDHPAFWKRGCQINGLQCLPIRTAIFNRIAGAGEYVFTVEFNDLDGNLFVLESCCGDISNASRRSQFEYIVVDIGDMQYRVIDMPVYMP